MIPSDLVILGGGCAGLSLGARLATLAAEGVPIPKTRILESRLTYEEDRTWCFWHPVEEPQPWPVAATWSRWRFSAGTDTTLHISNYWHYCCLRASDFYRTARERIASCPEIQLELGVDVTGLESHTDRVTIYKKSGTLETDTVVDCRTPDPAIARKATIHQVFLGFEIETEKVGCPSDTVGLMEDMAVDAQGFHFLYHLPLSPQRHLIEATRFSQEPLPPESLAPLLQKALGRFESEVRIVRQEAGVIPMGLSPQADQPRIISGGARGGAVRPSSGYAFQRIQDWAGRTASRLSESEIPVSTLPRGQTRMDHIFLRAMQKNPDGLPVWFLRIAETLSPESFARFMSDQATVGDRLSVIRALPVLPLLHAALGRSA